MAVSDGVVEVFRDMKVCALSEEVKKQKEMELFRLSEAKKIILGEAGRPWQVMSTKYGQLSLIFVRQELQLCTL